MKDDGTLTEKEEQEREQLKAELMAALEKPTPPLSPASFGFGEREYRLIKNCVAYAKYDPAGMPGHNLAIIIAKFAEYFGE